MAYKQHFLCQFGGTWVSTDMAFETWSCTLRCYTQDGGLGGWLLNPQGYCDQVATGLLAWFVASSSGIQGRAKLTYLKTNNINADGTYHDPITAIHTFSTANVGTYGNTLGFACLAYTWETGISIGKAKRGRMYPPNAYNVDSAGSKSVSVTTTDRDAARAAGKALLGVFGVVPTGGHTLKAVPAVFSKTAAVSHDITGVSVSSIIDVQRRRKKQATEARSSVLAYP